MKRLALLAAVLALPLALAAQVTSPTASVTQPANGPADIAGQLYAANFAHWTIKPIELGPLLDQPQASATARPGESISSCSRPRRPSPSSMWAFRRIPRPSRRRSRAMSGQAARLDCQRPMRTRTTTSRAAPWDFKRR